MLVPPCYIPFVVVDYTSTVLLYSMGGVDYTKIFEQYKKYVHAMRKFITGV